MRSPTKMLLFIILNKCNVSSGLLHTWSQTVKEFTASLTPLLHREFDLHGLRTIWTLKFHNNLIRNIAAKIVSLNTYDNPLDEVKVVLITRR